METKSLWSMNQNDNVISSWLRTMLFLLLVISIYPACNTTQKLSDSDYSTEIAKHREETESGLIIGDRAPLKESDLADLRYFPLSEAYRVTADVKLAKGESPFELPTYSGITKPYIKYATLDFTINGVKHTLNLYRNLQYFRMPQYKDYLFLPYKDVTNGESTYGGGRYINLLTHEIVDDKVTIDFNKSYNPWCAYSDGYNCPIPPIDNHLDIAITAGEMNFAGEKK